MLVRANKNVEVSGLCRGEYIEQWSRKSEVGLVSWSCVISFQTAVAYRDATCSIWPFRYEISSQKNLQYTQSHRLLQTSSLPELVRRQVPSRQSSRALAQCLLKLDRDQSRYHLGPIQDRNSPCQANLNCPLDRLAILLIIGPAHLPRPNLVDLPLLQDLKPIRLLVLPARLLLCLSKTAIMQTVRRRIGSQGKIKIIDHCSINKDLRKITMHLLRLAQRLDLLHLILSNSITLSSSNIDPISLPIINLVHPVFHPKLHQKLSPSPLQL